MVWQVLERLENTGGLVRAEVEGDTSGHYRYRILSWMPAAPEDEGALGDGFWQIDEVSGHYGWRGTCRNDAQRALRLAGAGP